MLSVKEQIDNLINEIEDTERDIGLDDEEESDEENQEENDDDTDNW